MIKKERLKELIEQGATIYVCNIDNVVGSIDFCEYEGRILKNCFQFRVRIKPNLSNYYGCEPNWSDDILLENIFETKEDCEEYAEFGNITRTERLELPSWKQVQEGFYYNGSVPIYEDDRNLCFISTSKDIVLKNYASLKNQTKFKKPLTRENYNEARRICVKLFKGEEV